MLLRPGVTARVDAAQWDAFDEPEGALAGSVSDFSRDAVASGARPGDVVYVPIGARVRIDRVTDARIALVRALGSPARGYAPVSRLVPEIPPGTKLVVAGTFEGYADFFARLDGAPGSAPRIATGTRVIALAAGVAPYDPSSGDFVRERVHVASGPLAGRTGWIAIAFLGIAGSAGLRTPIERTCLCRPISFALR